MVLTRRRGSKIRLTSFVNGPISLETVPGSRDVVRPKPTFSLHASKFCNFLAHATAVTDGIRVTHLRQISVDHRSTPLMQLMHLRAINFTCDATDTNERGMRATVINLRLLLPRCPNGLARSSSEWRTDPRATEWTTTNAD